MQSQSVLLSVVYAILAMFIVAAIYVIGPHKLERAEPCSSGRHLVYVHGSVPDSPELPCGMN